jgi:DnaJ-class molecular chaperone
MIQSLINSFNILGLSPSASKKEIRSAYIKYIKINHPDNGGTNDAIIKGKLAYDTIIQHNLKIYNVKVSSQLLLNGGEIYVELPTNIDQLIVSLSIPPNSKSGIIISLLTGISIHVTI